MKKIIYENLPCKQTSHSNKKKNSHGLVTPGQSTITHFDKHIDKHPKRYACTEHSHRYDHQSPCSSDECLV